MGPSTGSLAKTQHCLALLQTMQEYDFP